MKFTTIAPLLVLSLAACGRASAPGLGSHVPAVVKDSTPGRRVPDDKVFNLQILLPSQDREGMEALAHSLFDPHSADFHAFLTPDAWHARFDATDAQVEAARAALQAEGIETAPQAHASFLQARVDARTAERAFGARLFEFTAPDGTRFTAPDDDLRLPEALAQLAVVGLTEMPVRAAVSTPAQSNAVPVLQQDVWNTATLRKALGIPAAATGAGVVVGIIGVGGYAQSDTDAFVAANNLAKPDVKNVVLKGTGAPGGEEIEFDLDIQAVLSVVPNANVRVYEVSQGLVTELFVLPFQEMASPTLGDKLMPQVIDCSYGLDERLLAAADLAAIDQLFMRMAMQGQTVYASTGDFGAYARGGTTPIAQFPAVDPWVVAVGGTYVAVDAAGNYAGETTWYSNEAPGSASGGGGGISSLVPIPAWQVPLVNAASKGSTTQRNIPDVASVGDPNSGLGVTAGGQLYRVGGTSLAAPVWAGFHAAVEEARLTGGQQPLGFANPALYYLARTALYPALYHDVADGSTNGVFAAVPGLDNATGLGSFTPALLQVLALGPRKQAFSGAGWVTATGSP